MLEAAWLASSMTSDFAAHPVLRVANRTRETGSPESGRDRKNGMTTPLCSRRRPQVKRQHSPGAFTIQQQALIFFKD
jgi:hypothetical protein